jgi:dolichyl-phosphate beta-glucosyltransferase
MSPRPLERDCAGCGFSDPTLTSLIFPMYNPGPLIERTWREVRKFLEWAPGAWEVVFVCDGCTDGTADRLANLIWPEGPRMRLVSYAPNQGKGFAVRQGLLTARGQWRIFTDVDLAYGFPDMIRLARTLQGGADVAIGSRLHPESRLQIAAALQGYAYRRHLQSRVFSALVRCLLPVKQRDTQAGLKGLSASATEVILPHLGCNGFGFDCELLTACAHFGLSVAEVPVSVRYEDKVSTTNWRTMFGMIGEIWKIRRAWQKAPPPAAKAPQMPAGLPAGAAAEPINPVPRPSLPIGETRGGGVPLPLPLLSRGIM